MPTRSENRAAAHARAGRVKIRQVKIWHVEVEGAEHMIAHLRGKLIHKQPGQAIVEAGGVGYDVTISVPTFTALPSMGVEASLHIHTQVREDQIALFGFLERDEKRL